MKKNWSELILEILELAQEGKLLPTLILPDGMLIVTVVVLRGAKGAVAS